MLGFGTGSTLLNFSLPVVEAITLLVQLTLQIDDLALLLLLDDFEFVRKAFVELTTFLIPFV